ncbi:MAG TPA: hypothetical protein VLZ83_13230 [Edaphocola sp.]|nr:hypothetical protein [Edaphocola sp.]
MTKAEKRRLITLLAFLVGAFVLMILIGANIPFEAVVAPDPIPTSQKFLEFCVDAKNWLVNYAPLIGIVGVAGYLVLKLQPKRRK